MQTISCVLPRFISAALAACLLPGLTGCEAARHCSLTYKLWTNGEMRRFYEPAPNPRLELSYDRKQGDVLAAYDEAHETRSAIRRRAYFVNRNRIRVEGGHKPRFVKPERGLGLAVIPRAGSGSPAAPLDSAPIQAVVSTNGQQFTLSGDFGGHTYQLPVYQDQSALVVRVLLCPLAVAGDVVMVGAVAGVVAGYFYAMGMMAR